MKALLIAYHFPPDGMIGGVRPHQLARYLPQFGVEPWVLTVEPRFAEQVNPGLWPQGVPNERILRTPVDTTTRDRVIRLWQDVAVREDPAGTKQATRPRRFRGLREWALSCLSFPDPRIGWFRPALRRAEEALHSVGFDVLISTSPPRVAALVACELARRHRLPWVMDLRDPWQMNWEGSGSASMSVRFLLRRLFRGCVNTADAIVHNTERLRLSTCQLVPGAEGKTLCIPNGIEPEWATTSTSEDLQGVFGIGYYGNIMGRRSSAVFLEGFRRWLDARRPDAARVAVRFVGTGFEGVAAQVASLGLDHIVKLHPPVPRRQIRSLMNQDFVLLVLANDQPLQVPGKAYDCLAAGRRILSLTDRDGATADLLGPLGGCAVAERPDEVASALDAFYKAFERGSSPRVDRAALLDEAQYPRRVERFADAIRRIAGAAPALQGRR